MRLPVVALLAVLLPAPGLPVVAQTLGAAEAAPEVGLIDGWAQADGSRIAAVTIALAPGWHTYWRVPGEAGIPPRFDWSQSRNLAGVAYEWPRPEIIETYGMRSYGYHETLVLPVRLTPRDPSAPLEVVLTLAFGVCADICVPAEARLSVELAPDAGAGPAGRARIEAALADRARSAGEAGVDRVTCALVPGQNGFDVAVDVTFAAEPAPGQVAVLETAQPGIWVGEAESRSEGRTVTARAPVLGGAAGPALERGAMRVTLLDAKRAVDIRGCEAPG